MYCNYTGRTRSKCTKDALDNGFNTDDGLPDTCMWPSARQRYVL